jgi:hypothetical protein
VNVQEVTKLLAVVVAYDGRNVGESTVVAWFDALHGLTYEDCELAVREHYRDEPGWLMPAQVRQRVKAKLRDQASRADLTKAIAAPAEGVAGPNDAYLAARGERRDPDRALALTVICPHCKAWAGKPCVDTFDVPLRESPAHPSRIELAGGDPEWAILGRSKPPGRSDPSAPTREPRSGAHGAPRRVSAGDWQGPHPSGETA